MEYETSIRHNMQQIQGIEPLTRTLKIGSRFLEYKWNEDANVGLPKRTL
jgi:hypothetical protein